MSVATKRTAAFGPYLLDLRSAELQKFGTRLKIGEQTFQILRILLEAEGELVTRDELRAQMWGNDVFVDFDHGLNSAVQRLRDALSDSAENPRWIETVPRRGYRFIGKVEWAAEQAAVTKTRLAAEDEASRSVAPNHPSTPFPMSAVPHPSSTSPRQANTKLNRPVLLLACALILIVGLVSLPIRSKVRESSEPPAPAVHSIAVLPLMNLSSDPDQNFLADGMTEELTTDLGKISALRVISRTSAMRYKGSTKPLAEVARDLNVDAVVEGTVTRSGNQLHVTASLIQTNPEKHLWADSYDREVGNALSIEQEIARAVALQIRIKLTPREQQVLSAVHSSNPEAQDLYLRGLYLFRGGTTDSSKKAASFFERAIALDPNYAAPYARLAELNAIWLFGMGRPRDQMPKSKAFALKALELDSTSAAPHSVLGTIALFYDWDWPAAEREYQVATAIDPNNAWIHEWHARGLVAQGRTDEAIGEATLALQLSPSPMTWDYPIWVFLLARRYDLAEARAQALIDVDPMFPWGYFEMAQIDEQQGKFEEAGRAFLKSDELFSASSADLPALKAAFAASGYNGYWRRKLESYEKAARSEYVPSVVVAGACVRVGNHDRALYWLEKGFEERDDLMINLRADPIFDGLHSDPRFQDLVRRVGFP